MAGNFWSSSHYQRWILLKQDLLYSRHEDLKNFNFSEDDYQKLMIFYANVIQLLGEQMKVRQQVIATATVYFKRFYARYSLRCIDPLLMIPTSLSLASKVEEFGLFSNTKMINNFKTLIKTKLSYAFSEFPYEPKNIQECEFYLLEILECSLVVYHPYRSLKLFVSDLIDGNDTQQLLSIAWRVCNDSLRTDLCLLYPPYLIALGCLYLACVSCKFDCVSWFAELHVDMDKVWEVIVFMRSLYQLWNVYDERKNIPELLSKTPKPKTEN